MKKDLAALGAGHSVSLSLVGGLTIGDIQDRIQLLSRLDQVRREIDQSGSMEAMDRFRQQAVSILTSGQFAAAMDLSNKDPKFLASPTFAHGLPRCQISRIVFRLANPQIWLRLNVSLEKCCVLCVR